jgi:hypothetical protein
MNPAPQSNSVTERLEWRYYAGQKLINRLKSLTNASSQELINVIRQVAAGAWSSEPPSNEPDASGL